MENPREFTRKHKKPFLDGIFYPSSPETMNDMIDEYLPQSRDINEAADGVIIPHGAWDYTLPFLLSACTFTGSSDHDAVIFAAPFHNDFSNKIWLPEYTLFDYPGSSLFVKLPDSLLSKINVNNNIKTSNMPFDEETSFEPLLPVFSRFCGSKALIPFFYSVNASRNTIESVYSGLKSSFRSPFWFVSANIKHDTGFFCCADFIDIFLSLTGTNPVSHIQQTDNARNVFNVEHKMFILKKG